MSPAEEWLGATVQLPTPIRDKVSAYGIQSLELDQLAHMPVEMLMAKTPGVVLAVDGNTALVKHRAGTDRFGLELLRRLDGKG